MTSVKLSVNQRGKSAISNLIVLTMLGFGIWVGIQYIPQKLEAGAVQTMLDRVKQRHNATPFRDDGDLWKIIDAQLSVNDMRDMRKNIKVVRNGNNFTVNVYYERDLNLVFTTKKMEYRDSLRLN